MFESSVEPMVCEDEGSVNTLTHSISNNMVKHILKFNKNNLFSIDIDELVKRSIDNRLVRKFYSRISLSCCIVPDWYEYTNFVLLEYIMSKLFGDKYEEETTDMFIIKNNKRKKGIISKSLSFGKHY